MPQPSRYPSPHGPSPHGQGGGRLVRARYDNVRELAAYVETRETDGLNRTERDLLAAFFPPGASLLDVGCGAGREAFGAAHLGYRITALDFANGLLQEGARSGRRRGLDIRWILGDATSLPVRSAAFDGALVVSQLLEHFHGRATRVAVLREAARTVRRGGHLLVSVHNGRWRPGLRQWAWGYAERRASGDLPRGGTGWRRLIRRQRVLRAGDLRDARRLAGVRLRWIRIAAERRARASALEVGDGYTDTVSHAGPGEVQMPFHPYNSGELARDAEAAGLRVAAELPWPRPPRGALGQLARRGSPYWYAALEVR